MRREYEKFRVLKQKRIESARHAAHARYERNDASRMRNACESEAPRIRDECLSFSYSNTKEEIDIPADSMEQLFAEFWEAYPRKEVPSQARKAFEKLKPDRQLLATILAWLTKAKLSKQWQEIEFVPLPATFLNQKYWEGDPPPQATLRADTVGLSCAEPAGEYQCDICEGTGRLLVLFNRDNGTQGNAVGCAPWSAIREKVMAGEGQETRLFRCACKSGQDHSQLKIWVP
jgi:hypothetical protein